MKDQGGLALLDSPLILQLEKLDLSHHYMSDALVEKLRKLEIEIDLKDQLAPESYNREGHPLEIYYTAVGE